MPSGQYPGNEKKAATIFQSTIHSSRPVAIKATLVLASISFIQSSRLAWVARLISTANPARERKSNCGCHLWRRSVQRLMPTNHRLGCIGVEEQAVSIVRRVSAIAMEQEQSAWADVGCRR